MKLKKIFKLIKSIPLRLRFLVFFAVLSIGLMVTALINVIPYAIGFSGIEEGALLVAGNIMFFGDSTLDFLSIFAAAYPFAFFVVLLKKGLTLRFKLFIIIILLSYLIFIYSILMLYIMHLT